MHQLVGRDTQCNSNLADIADPNLLALLSIEHCVAVDPCRLSELALSQHPVHAPGPTPGNDAPVWAAIHHALPLSFWRSSRVQRRVTSYHIGISVVDLTLPLNR